MLKGPLWTEWHKFLGCSIWRRAQTRRLQKSLKCGSMTVLAKMLENETRGGRLAVLFVAAYDSGDEGRIADARQSDVPNREIVVGRICCERNDFEIANGKGHCVLCVDEGSSSCAPIQLAFSRQETAAVYRRARPRTRRCVFKPPHLERLRVRIILQTAAKKTLVGRWSSMGRRCGQQVFEITCSVHLKVAQVARVWLVVFAKGDAADYTGLFELKDNVLLLRLLRRCTWLRLTGSSSSFTGGRGRRRAGGRGGGGCCCCGCSSYGSDRGTVRARGCLLRGMNIVEIVRRGGCGDCMLGWARPSRVHFMGTVMKDIAGMICAGP